MPFPQNRLINKNTTPDYDEVYYISMLTIWYDEFGVCTTIDCERIPQIIGSSRTPKTI